jgi:hypothetical protein
MGRYIGQRRYLGAVIASVRSAVLDIKHGCRRLGSEICHCDWVSAHCQIGSIVHLFKRRMKAVIVHCDIANRDLHAMPVVVKTFVTAAVCMSNVLNQVTMRLAHDSFSEAGMQKSSCVCRSCDYTFSLPSNAHSNSNNFHSCKCMCLLAPIGLEWELVADVHRYS